jgi:hypothetical protein
MERISPIFGKNLTNLSTDSNGFFCFLVYNLYGKTRPTIQSVERIPAEAGLEGHQRMVVLITLRCACVLSNQEMNPL